MKSFVAVMMIALGCAAAAEAGESGGVTRPPSIGTGNIYQGYHPLWEINMYASYPSGMITVAEHSYVSMNPIEGAGFVPPAVVDSPTPVQGVPEPSTAILGLGAAAFIAACRGRRRG